MYVHYNPVRSFEIEEKGRIKKNNDEVSAIKLKTVYHSMEKKKAKMKAKQKVSKMYSKQTPTEHVNRFLLSRQILHAIHYLSTCHVPSCSLIFPLIFPLIFIP